MLFLAQVFNQDLTFAEQIKVVLMSILAGVGTAGVPGGSIPLIMIVLRSVDVPPEGIAIILGVDRLCDMCRTVLNVSGDLVLATCVAGEETADVPPDATAAGWRRRRVNRLPFSSSTSEAVTRPNAARTPSTIATGPVPPRVKNASDLSAGWRACRGRHRHLAAVAEELQRSPVGQHPQADDVVGRLRAAPCACRTRSRGARRRTSPATPRTTKPHVARVAQFDLGLDVEQFARDVFQADSRRATRARRRTRAASKRSDSTSSTGQANSRGPAGRRAQRQVRPASSSAD